MTSFPRLSPPVHPSVPTPEPAPLARFVVAVCRPAAWAVVAFAAALAPLVSAGDPEPPFGRPWYLGRLVALVAAMVALLVGARRLGAVLAPGVERRALAVLVFLVSYSVFVANQRTISSGDNLPTRALPLALLAGDGFDLARVVPVAEQRHYSLVRKDGELRSAFPVGTGLLATPYFALARALSPSAGELGSERAQGREKHLAALLSALAVALVFLAGAVVYPADGARALLALALATGTPVLTSLSQGLWSHTGEIFLAAVACFLVSRPRRERACELAAGVALGAAFLCRPTVVLLLPVVACFARRGFRAAPRLAAGFAAVAGGAALVNWALWGNPLGAYAHLNAGERKWHLAGFSRRLMGVLASPSRGLAWFLPALVAALAIAALAWRRLAAERRTMLLASLATVASVVLLTAFYRNWWGGSSLGPRLLVELALPLFVLAALALTAGGRRARALLVALFLAQSLVHLRLYSSERAVRWYATVGVGPRSPAALFSLRDSLLAAAFVPDWEPATEARE